VKEKRLLKAFWRAALVLVLEAVMLFPMGCSKMLPTAPEEPVEGYRGEDLWPAPPANLGPLLQTCSQSVAGWFSSAGGELDIEGRCMNVSFYVPRRALSERVRISMTATLFYYYTDRTVLNGLLLDFRPDGLVFSRPAILQLEANVLEAADGDVLTLYWYNPDTGLWEVEQRVKVDGEEVEFKIYHFSRYAIS
jgi:hypothetical protein